MKNNNSVWIRRVIVDRRHQQKRSERRVAQKKNERRVVIVQQQTTRTTLILVGLDLLLLASNCIHNFIIIMRQILNNIYSISMELCSLSIVHLYLLLIPFRRSSLKIMSLHLYGTSRFHETMAKIVHGIHD